MSKNPVEVHVNFIKDNKDVERFISNKKFIQYLLFDEIEVKKIIKTGVQILIDNSYIELWK